MQRSTATRRLVKSPPELWAELSSEDILGRHLAQFGEIRITRVSPETTVAWEGERICGTVELEATGWGTKVSLTATPTADPTPRIELRAPEPTPEPEPEPGRAPEKPRGFFARLFRRRPRPAEAQQPAAGIPGPPVPMPDPSPPTPGPEPGPPAPGPDPTPGPGGPDPGPAPNPGPPLPEPGPPSPLPPPGAPQIGARPAVHAAEDCAQTVAILTGVLDDLGAAHHRPFSRD